MKKSEKQLRFKRRRLPVGQCRDLVVAHLINGKQLLLDTVKLCVCNSKNKVSIKGSVIEG